MLVRRPGAPALGLGRQEQARDPGGGWRPRAPAAPGPGSRPELLAEHLAGVPGRRAAPPPAGPRGRGRASGSRGAARAAAPRPTSCSSSRDQLGVAPASEVGVDPVLERRPPELLEPGRLPPEQPLVVRPVERAVPATAPRRRGSASAAAVDVARQPAPRGPARPPPRSTGRRSRRRARRGGSRRAPVTSASLSGPEGAAQLRHERLQGVGAAGRQVVAPELVGQALGLDRLAGPDEEEQQERALLGAPDGQRRRRRRRPGARRASGTSQPDATPALAAGTWALPSGQRRIRAPSGPRSHVGGMTTTATATRVRRPRAEPDPLRPPRRARCPPDASSSAVEDLAVGDVLQHDLGHLRARHEHRAVPRPDHPAGARPPHPAERADRVLLLLDRRARPPHRPQGRGDAVRRPRQLAPIRETVARRRRRSAAGASSAARSRSGRGR